MEGPVLKTRQELATEAREHYDHVALEAHDWLSTIPQAIDAWERQPELEAENARLRALLRELVEGQNRPGHWCTYCGEYQAGTYSSHDGHGVIIKHTDDCPVARARAEVGDSAGDL